LRDAPLPHPAILLPRAPPPRGYDPAVCPPQYGSHMSHNIQFWKTEAHSVTAL